ncbi:MAG: hypothetical protein RIC55_30290 [Pirellulaceae bacterium]
MGIRRASVLLGCFFLAAFTVTALADRALPNVPPPFERPETPPREPAQPKLTSDPVNFQVKRDRSAKTSKIVIPRHLLAGAASTTGASEGSGYGLPVQSIVAGIALSLAVVAGFLVIRRIGKRSSLKTAGAVAVAAGVVGLWAASSAVADLAFPEKPGKSQIVIEVVDKGDTVVLTLGRDAP